MVAWPLPLSPITTAMSPGRPPTSGLGYSGLGLGWDMARMWLEWRRLSRRPSLQAAPVPGSPLALIWVPALTVGPRDQAQHQPLWEAWPHPHNNTAPAAPPSAIREGTATAELCCYTWPGPGRS